MKTPAGKECRYYYEDFHRGRERQECRLIVNKGGAARWRPDNCARCPVPDILWANASEHLRLRAEINPGILGIGRKVEVEARCARHSIAIEDPYVGCPQCADERIDLSAFQGS